jgi:hypothetical protein
MTMPFVWLCQRKANNTSKKAHQNAPLAVPQAQAGRNPMANAVCHRSEPAIQ